MALIAGASAYLNSSTLANTKQLAVSTDNLLGRSTASILDAGRRINRSGIGLSSSARQLTQKFLSDTAGLGNALLSATAEANVTKNLQTRIMAIRASLPESAIDPDVYLTAEEREAKEASAKGRTIDETV